MTKDRFNLIANRRINVCREILADRADIYSDYSDRLSNFKAAGFLQQTTSFTALGGMLAKHVVALFDFIRAPVIVPPSQWEEKITDIINYCLLLEALLVENNICEGKKHE
jgi:hypothetical protein